MSDSCRPVDAARVGDRVRVMVVAVDTASQRVPLSVRGTQTRPVAGRRGPVPGGPFGVVLTAQDIAEDSMWGSIGSGEDAHVAWDPGGEGSRWAAVQRGGQLVATVADLDVPRRRVTFTLD